MPSDISIHTINARSAFFQFVIDDICDMKKSGFLVNKSLEEIIYCEIRGTFFELLEILKNKGIKYTSLKSALIPSTKKSEAAFIFDTQHIETIHYGREIIDKILPLLDKESTHSVLCGDFIGEREDQEFISNMLKENLILCRNLTFIHSSAFHCIYINNISDFKIKEINTALTKYSPYCGYMDMKFTSVAKGYFADILIKCFIKHKNKIIMEHGDDLPNEENYNYSDFCFEKFGLKVFSLQSLYFDIFLGYKIERPVITEGDKVDVQMSINSISKKLFPLDELKIEIDDGKFGYLHKNKLGKLKKAGIDKLKREQLIKLVKYKISENYIYNLEYLSQYDVSKFNIILEIPNFDNLSDNKFIKYLVALKYLSKEKTLYLISMH